MIMNNIIAYIVELNITLTALFLLYLLIFRKDSNFSLRRAFLFFAMMISIIFPLIHVTIGNSQAGMYPAIISLDEVLVRVRTGVFSSGSSVDIIQGSTITYLVIAASFLLRLSFMLLRILLYAVRSKKTLLSGTPVRINSKLHASSFFNLIFIDPEVVNEDNRDHILQHEKHHVKLLHSVDRLIAEIILSISWINPVAWMYRKSIITNHEYQADNKVISYGTDKASYQLSILNQYIGSASISNQFSSQIKNRIIMLNKNYKKGSFWKSLLLIPAGLVLFVFISCTNEGTTDVTKNTDVPAVEKQIFYVVEEMPKWHDGSEMNMEIRKFIATKLNYPTEAKENGAQGKVYIHFIVTETGKVKIPSPSQLPPEKTNAGEIEDVVVVAYKPINVDDAFPDEKYIQLLKAEAIRVIGEVPDLIPGKQRGVNVSVIFTMPITFALK